MKALIISSLLFFSLRAMSAEVSEQLKSECSAIDSSNRAAKVVESEASTEQPKQNSSSAVRK